MSNATVAPVTTERPAFRQPWRDGAKAYTEADTFAAAHKGFKRIRKNQMFKMTNDHEAGDVPCAACGIKLGEAYPINVHNNKGETKVDKHSTWDYIPATKSITGGMHYGCSWGSLLQELLEARNY